MYKNNNINITPYIAYRYLLHNKFEKELIDPAKVEDSKKKENKFKQDIQSKQRTTPTRTATDKIMMNTTTTNKTMINEITTNKMKTKTAT